MELFTRNFDPSWDRIVDLSVEKTNGVSQYIHDEGTYKLIVVDSGTLTVSDGVAQTVLLAPAVISVSNTEKLTYQGDAKLKTTTIFFKPSVIREDFDDEAIQSGIYEEQIGKTVYMDYVLVRNFYEIRNPLERVIHFGPVSYKQTAKLIQQMDYELRVQHDGFWPCRSRSIFVELLHHFVYDCNSELYSRKAGGEQTFTEESVVATIIRYFNDHIDEDISLDDVIKEAGMNRNQLNALFVKETSLTCMNYLINMRMHLAMVILSETELPIGEISVRVGYADLNYFTRLFKKRVGMTPTQFRKNPNLELINNQ